MNGNTILYIMLILRLKELHMQSQILSLLCTRSWQDGFSYIKKCNSWVTHFNVAAMSKCFPVKSIFKLKKIFF